MKTAIRHTAPVYTWLLVLLVLGSALLLAGCNKSDNRSAGEQLDSAVAKTEQAVETARDKTKEYARDVESKTGGPDSTTASDLRQGVANATQAAKDAGTAVVATVNDAAITAAVSAGLAKDPDLSAFKINVETKDGTVSLRGSAPSAHAKARAEDIAKGVRGVSTVDNQLEVKA
jgi:hyperosmotically inducible protein